MKLTKAGRSRWKIENQGFNRQKNWQGNIGHACSWNERAQKNHYLLEQISDFMKQLYEYFFLKKNEIKKAQKNISSDLLKSFAEQQTSEDISEEPNESAQN
jgi:predicted small metal-binding protein